MGETHAYWMQFFYTEKLHERQQLAEQINEASAPSELAPDEAQSRRIQRKAALDAYNRLNRLLRLPEEDPDRDLERDLAAAQRGETPAFLRDRRG